tara:strand:- start:579 stop:800 length:222 start_codon:yes stop_codon:yes gene_type:complete
MKELYLEITFWTGATAIVGLLSILAFKLLEIALNYIGSHSKIAWNIYEYAYYKKEFKEWIELSKSKRHPKSKK